MTFGGQRRDGELREYGRVVRTLAADGGAGGAGGDGAAVGHSTTGADEDGGGCNGRHLLCFLSFAFWSA